MKRQPICAQPPTPCISLQSVITISNPNFFYYLFRDDNNIIYSSELLLLHFSIIKIIFSCNIIIFHKFPFFYVHFRLHIYLAICIFYEVCLNGGNGNGTEWGGSKGSSSLWDSMQHPTFDSHSYYSIYTRTKDQGNGFYIILLSWQGMRNTLRKCCVRDEIVCLNRK